MKNKKIRIYMTLMLLFITTLSVGCNSKKEEVKESTSDEMNIYFASESDSELIAEKVLFDTLECKTDKEKVNLAISALKEGPKTPSLLPVVSNDYIIKGVILEDNYVSINFSEEYNELPVQNQMILRASFVRTLTDLSFVNSVEFFVGKEPLKSLEDELIGPIYKDDIVLEQPNPKPDTNVQNIILYFGDDEGQGLVAENRRISVSTNVPLEKYIVEELINGPTNENHFRTIPDGTEINDIGTQDGVCQIDLSSEFQSKHQGGSIGEVLTIYSIVNSLTESSQKIKKVAFLIDGKKQSEFKGHLDFSMLFERDESLIVETTKE